MVCNVVPVGNQTLSFIFSPVHWNVFGLAFIVPCSVTIVLPSSSPKVLTQQLCVHVVKLVFILFIKLFHCCNVNTPVHQAVQFLQVSHVITQIKSLLVEVELVLLADVILFLLLLSWLQKYSVTFLLHCVFSKMWDQFSFAP